MPEPSRLVLLDQLHTVEPGSKVRFLGCVHAYDGVRAQLVLKLKYPATEPDAPTAIVALDNVLEYVNHSLLEVGTWLNVVGCVQSLSGSERPTHKSIKRTTEGSKQAQPTLVNAQLIWSAGALKLERYESAVQAYQKPLHVG